jgi:hypothetical protein
MGIPYIICGKLEKVREEFRHRAEATLLEEAEDVDSVMTAVKVFVITATSKQFNLLCQRRFDFVVMLEASRLPLLQAVSSLRAGTTFVLFGDAILDSGVDSVYSELARLDSVAIVHLWEMYNCEPAIVAASRVVWGSEMRSASPHATVNLRPFKVLDKDHRGFFTEVVGMARPVVFVAVEELSAAVLLAVVAGLVYESVSVIARREILPQIASALFVCRNEPDRAFSKFVEFMQAAVNRIAAFGIHGLSAGRRDTVVAIGDNCNSELLQVALGMTRRKLILIGNPAVIRRSPLWAALLNHIPKEWMFEFPREYSEEEWTPFRPIGPIFRGAREFDIEDVAG